MVRVISLRSFLLRWLVDGKIICPVKKLMLLLEQVCQSWLLSGRNVCWPRHMLPPGESRWVCRRDRWMDGRRTVTLRFSLWTRPAWEV